MVVSKLQIGGGTNIKQVHKINYQVSVLTGYLCLLYVIILM